MKNKHVDTLMNGHPEHAQFIKTKAVRKDDAAYIEKLKSDGWVEHDPYEACDLVILGLPKGKDKQKGKEK